MALFTHLLWILSYLIIAAFATVSLNRGLGLDLYVAGSLGGLLFLAALQAHGAIVRQRDRRDVRQRLMALYHDYQSAMDVAEETRNDMQFLEEELARKENQRDRELIAEMKVLQTLLAQVAARSATHPKMPENSRTPPVEDRGSSNYQAIAHGALRGKAEEAAGIAPKSEADGGGADGPEVGRTDMAPSETTRDEILHIMHNALEKNRIDLYLQPIVSLPSRKVCHYEAFSRVRDVEGHIIFPRQYLPVAEEAGLAGTLDNLLLFRCIQTIRRLGARRPGIKFFCNISPSSLQDDEFFPQFVDFMLANPELSERLVFEFSQADAKNHSREVMAQLDDLARHGFTFSVDQVSDLRFAFIELSRRYFRYVKVESGLFLGGGGDIHPEDMKDALHRLEMDLIIEKIEEETTVLDILDYDVEYGQGYLFGEPRLSRDTGEASQST